MRKRRHQREETKTDQYRKEKHGGTESSIVAQNDFHIRRQVFCKGETQRVECRRADRGRRGAEGWELEKTQGKQTSTHYPLPEKTQETGIFFKWLNITRT